MKRLALAIAARNGPCGRRIRRHETLYTADAQALANQAARSMVNTPAITSPRSRARARR